MRTVEAASQRIQNKKDKAIGKSKHCKMEGAQGFYDVHNLKNVLKRIGSLHKT
jgi:hypothetical protein